MRAQLPTVLLCRKSVASLTPLTVQRPCWAKCVGLIVAIPLPTAPLISYSSLYLGLVFAAAKSTFPLGDFSAAWFHMGPQLRIDRYLIVASVPSRFGITKIVSLFAAMALLTGRCKSHMTLRVIGQLTGLVLSNVPKLSVINAYPD